MVNASRPPLNASCRLRLKLARDRPEVIRHQYEGPNFGPIKVDSSLENGFENTPRFFHRNVESFSIIRTIGDVIKVRATQYERLTRHASLAETCAMYT